MSFLEEMLEKARIAANVAGEKAGEIYEVSKLKLQAVQIANEISKTYELLGRLHYDNVKKATDNMDMIQATMREIQSLLAALAEIDEIIAKETGSVQCPSCGAMVSAGSVYCGKCGMKIARDEAIVVSVQDTVNIPVE